MNKEKINTVLLTIITILISGVAGFVISMDNKIDVMREAQIRNEMMIMSHQSEADLWIEKIKQLDKDD